MEGVTRGLAVDLRPIRINCVCPGATKTALFDAMGQEVLGPPLEQYRKTTMTGTIASPEDMAESYLYCMRDGYVDGIVIHTSGAYLLA